MAEAITRTLRLSMRRVWSPNREGAAYMIIGREGLIGPIYKLYTRNAFAASLCDVTAQNQHGDLYVTFNDHGTILQVQPVGEPLPVAQETA